MSAMTFPAPTQTILHPHLSCTIAGRPVPVLSFDSQHGVNQPIGTASVTLPLPLPDHLRGEDARLLNRHIEIQAGHTETAIRTVFSGRIDADRMTIDERERTATISARGWATLLDWEEETDLVFPPGTALHDIIRSLCQWRGVPSYVIEPITFPRESSTVLLGGNPSVDDGDVVIPRRSSPLTWIDRKCQLFGYRVFDTPSGQLRVQRVSGIPTGEPAASFVDGRYGGDGSPAFRMEKTRDLGRMVTYWTVEGKTYTDIDGVQIPIRSIPDSVPYSELLNPPGYRAGRISDNDVVYVSVARAIREVAEIDTGAPYQELRWEAVGNAWLHPGDVVRLTFPDFDEDRAHWLMGVRQRLDARDGYVTNYDAWSGRGEALARGSDLVELPVLSEVRHVGDEWLSHYVVPAPGGTTISIPFTVPDEYTSIAVRGKGHGANSFLIDGANTDSTVSKVEVYQNGESVGSAEMPVMPENLLQRLDYRQDRYWETFRMPVPGRLEPGPAELRFVSGVDNAGGQDDFEIKDVVLELRGIGRPTLPTPRGF